MEGADSTRRRAVESDAWEDFLDMTISQALLWASNNIDPATTDSELVLTEPYLMGSHAGTCGAWCSGPEDVAPSEYFWGYNRMTTVQGLFAAGDGCGLSAHKFSSGSYTEGRLAAKAAVNFAYDHSAAPNVDGTAVEQIQRDIWAPLIRFEEHRHATTRDEINPNYLLHKQALHRLQKMMDEYAGGWGSSYMTNEPMLNRGLEQMAMFKEDFAMFGARDLHELLRCWEVVHRAQCGETHMRHLLSRKETRWPGYYYRGDYPNLDDANWKHFINSHYDRNTGEWEFRDRPYIQVVP
jgi:adenylylsulfate reductase subunit A